MDQMGDDSMIAGCSNVVVAERDGMLEDQKATTNLPKVDRDYQRYQENTITEVYRGVPELMELENITTPERAQEFDEGLNDLPMHPVAHTSSCFAEEYTHREWRWSENDLGLMRSHLVGEKTDLMEDLNLQWFTYDLDESLEMLLTPHSLRRAR